MIIQGKHTLSGTRDALLNQEWVGLECRICFQVVLYRLQVVCDPDTGMEPALLPFSQDFPGFRTTGYERSAWSGLKAYGLSTYSVFGMGTCSDSASRMREHLSARESRLSRIRKGEDHIGENRLMP